MKLNQWSLMPGTTVPYFPFLSERTGWKRRIP